MTNKQARLIATAIALLGGSVAANAEQFGDVGVLVIVIAGALFIAEYIRCQKDS